MTDYSIIKPIELQHIKVASTEFTLDFWYFLFSYVEDSIGFDSHDFIWNKHLKITLYKSGNTNVAIKCTPLYDDANPNEILDSAIDEKTPKLNIWVYIQCSVNLSNSNVYLNGVKSVPKLLSDKIDPNLKETTLVIKSGDKAKTNYGFLFLREIKLYGKYQIQDFNTKCTYEYYFLYYLIMNLGLLI